MVHLPRDPDNLLPRARRLDPEFDIVKEPAIFVFTLATGQTFEIEGEENRDLTIENLEDDGVAFTVEPLAF